MGPMKSISEMIRDVNDQATEIRGMTRRMRDANRRLTGGTGEAPTTLNAVATEDIGKTAADARPLLVSLTVALEALNSATSAMRDEISYAETFSETGNDQDEKLPYSSQGLGPSAGYARG